MDDKELEALEKLSKDIHEAWNKPRNPDRIGIIIDELRDYWREHPDLRFGQIIYNITRDIDTIPDSDYASRLFYLEDDEFLKKLERYIR